MGCESANPLIKTGMGRRRVPLPWALPAFDAL